MEKNNLNKEKENWINRWIFNNQVLMPLIALALGLLIVLLFTKVSYLFTPVAQFIGIVGLPIIISGLLYYIFNPVVNFMEKKGIKRNLGITILYVAVFGLLTWGIIILVPKIENQTKSFIEDWPIYWKTIEMKTTEFFNAPLFEKFSDPIEKSINELFNSINAITKTISKNAFAGIGSFVGAVAIMFIIGFSVIGLNYSVTLGILAGFLNLVPYVGSALATIPAIILALVDGPKMLIAVIIVFIIEQTIEGKFISPLVLGSQLDIHPVTIIFVLLSAGKIFGIMGVILGIPFYAAMKVIVTHLFRWYKEASGLYEEAKKETSSE